ncbi:MAG: adenylate/guanylate cyclase domain-containing protein, partial [Actinomycetota bacterium]
MSELPTGTVTFLFTDIQGSTNLARALGERWEGVLDAHHGILRAAIERHDGLVIRTEGDAFFAVFSSAVDAVAATAAAQRGLAGHEWPPDGAVRVRMGLHTGEGRLDRQGEYIGLDVHRAARVAAAGHGGQVLLSNATRAVVSGRTPDDISLRDLGPHRLKDFDEPEPIYQVEIEGLPADFPPLKTLDIPTNLPAELTSFVGRDRELAEVTRLLDDGRLVTLVGPGGTGKTRLALRVGSEVVDRFPDGVFFVELASIIDPELVPSVIAAAVGTGEHGPRPVMDVLASELRVRTSLLLLDNFEQIVQAAPVVSTLLGAAPNVRFVVTSRSALRVQGERVFPVPPLEIRNGHGSGVDLLRSEAIALFADRAAAVDPSFRVDEDNASVVAEICRRLDGLPLAIELAASRLRLLAPAALLERLDRALPLLASRSRDLPERQRTLRGAIEWSHDLLTPSLQTLFRRICVFAGGFTIEAAGAVGDPDGELDEDVLDALEGLYDTSLVRRVPKVDEVRFDTLQTVREFGLERLEASGEAPAVQR